MMTLEEYRASVKREWDDAMLRQQQARTEAKKAEARMQVRAANQKIDFLVKMGQW